MSVLAIPLLFFPFQERAHPRTLSCGRFTTIGAEMAGGERGVLIMMCIERERDKSSDQTAIDEKQIRITERSGRLASAKETSR